MRRGSPNQRYYFLCERNKRIKKSNALNLGCPVSTYAGSPEPRGFGLVSPQYLKLQLVSASRLFQKNYQPGNSITTLSADYKR